MYCVCVCVCVCREREREREFISGINGTNMCIHMYNHTITTTKVRVMQCTGSKEEDISWLSLW